MLCRLTNLIRPKQLAFALAIFALTLLIGIATPMLWQRFDRDPIKRAIRNASRLTEVKNEESIRDWLFTLVRSGRTETALEFARHTHADRERVQAYLFVAEALKEIGSTAEADKVFDQTLRVASAIPVPDVRSSALATVWARKGRSDKAFNELEQIIDDDIRTDTRADICVTLVQIGEFDTAILGARKEDSWFRNHLLLQVAEALVNANQPERARALAVEVIKYEDPAEASELLERYVSTVSQAGLSDELFKAFRAFEERDLYIAPGAFEAIAVESAKVGNTDKALTIVRSIDAKDGRARALAAVSEVLREQQNEVLADEILSEALATAQDARWDTERSWALHKIGPILVKAGRADEAIKAVRGLGPADNEAMAFTAVTMTESGKWDEAKGLMWEAFNGATNTEHAIVRSGVLLKLVRALVKDGKTAEALSFIEGAQAKVAKVVDGVYRSEACSIIAEAFAIVKDWDRAVAAAEQCDKFDQLAAYSAIVREYHQLAARN